ncbi:MAG: hypothetical protein J2P26_04460 [Nocardiopsaceae bacterium]|nr:hypothetical protein [Nocardiopsaceae bacterium]
MPAAAGTRWLEAADYAPEPTPRDLREFFGIPPDPPEALGDNIRTKRKHWKKKQTKARSADALKFAEAVLQAIAEAEDILTRGATASGGASGTGSAGGSGGGFGGSAGTAEREPRTIDDVWRELERLLFRGRYHEALDRVRGYEARWGKYPNFVDMRSEVILEAAQNIPDSRLDPRLMESAITGSRWAIDKIGPTEARYLTLVDLLEAAGRGREVPEVFADAARQLPSLSASFRVRELSTRFAREAWIPLLRHCVTLVTEAGEDRALRSELVQMIIERAVAELLPLSSAETVKLYQTVVAAATWIADGVPEAEDFVRLHRMWAANADQPVFGGDWQWRAFFGLITLFTALPLINSAMARPAWQILLAGPAEDPGRRRLAAGASRNRAWFLVTRNAYIMPVHEKTRLPWQDRPGRWPAEDYTGLFNF